MSGVRGSCGRCEREGGGGVVGRGGDRADFSGGGDGFCCLVGGWGVYGCLFVLKWCEGSW